MRNQIEQLFKNIQTLIETGCLEDEFKAFAEQNSECDSISGLNDIIESEMSYWLDDSEKESED